MRQDRFLITILIGIAVLVVLSLVLFFVRRGGQGYGPEETPEGVVRNYVIALQQRDYERALGYLAAFENRPDLPRFRQPFASYQEQELAITGLEIGETALAAGGQTAQVYLIVVRGGRGPFTDRYRENTLADLVLEGSSWKIRSMPYPYWSYDWPQSNATDAKPVPIP